MEQARLVTGPADVVDERFRDGDALLRIGDREAGVALLLRLAEDGTADPRDRQHALVRVSTSEYDAGNLERSLELAGRAIALAREHGYALGEAEAQVKEAVVFAALGVYGEAFDLGEAGRCRSPGSTATGGWRPAP